MNHSQLNSYNSFNSNPIEEPPKLSWIILGAFILFVTAGTAAGVGSLVRPGYVLFSVFIAIFFYFKYPPFYVGFTWWIWFATPLISRIVDYRSGFDQSRFMLIAQYLVTLVCFYTFIKDLPKSYRQGGLPFIIAFIGLMYGFMIGLIKTTAFTAARSLLDWLVPIPFAFYLFMNWRSYPQFRKTIKQVFLWGVLFTGVYGIIQYLIAPEWDRFWLISTELTSFGDPEPLKIRVWSTMSSPGPFATMMMSGLLLLFTSTGPLTIPAAGAGYLTFLLTLVRTLWGCWFVGLLSMLSAIKPRLQMRLFMTILIMALCVVPLANMEPFGKVITTRLQSLTQLDKDDSANVRQEIYAEGVDKAVTNYLGSGIGNTFIVDKEGKLIPVVIDSGILDTFFTLGWFGAIPYLGGILLLFLKGFQFSEIRSDTFMAASRAVALGNFCALPGGSAMLGFSGVVLWSFLAIVMAAHKYHVHQRSIQNQLNQFY
ncbi:MAG: O-antigen ligase domain-containing protein [Cyanobacteria bacterium P01_A01_bin.84]